MTRRYTTDAPARGPGANTGPLWHRVLTRRYESLVEQHQSAVRVDHPAMGRNNRPAFSTAIGDFVERRAYAELVRFVPCAKLSSASDALALIPDGGETLLRFLIETYLETEPSSHLTLAMKMLLERNTVKELPF